MEEELKKWNVKAVQAQLVACKIKSSGLKEELVPRLAACPQFKPIFAAIMADPTRLFNAYLMTALKNEATLRGINAVGSREDLVQLLIDDEEEKTRGVISNSLSVTTSI